MTATVAGIHLGLDTHANRPAANTVPDGSIYSCSTHSLVYKSNFGGNSWATWATLGSAGSVATDTIWDAAGDLAVGTGADTAAKLTKGSALDVLRVNAGGTALEWAAPAAGTTRAGASVIDASGNHTFTSVTFVDLDTTYLGLTITTNGGPILVMFTGVTVGPGGSDRLFLDIAIDGTRVSGVANGLFVGGNSAVTENASIICKSGALAAGAHTVRVQGRVGSGTGTIQATASATVLIAQEQDA